MQHKNLTVIGTSHIARQSIEEVKGAIEQQKPDIVAVELDANRYYSLKSSRKTELRLKDMPHIGVAGFFFALLGRWAQKKLGKLVGAMPGEEMLTAIRFARKSKAEIRLIDQDISITLRRLSKAITFKEELRFVHEIIKAVFFGKREMRRLGIEDIDLTKVPETKIIKKLVDEFRKNYPNVYRVLVTERNIVMAKRLADIMERNKGRKILAVVGAGHEEELLDLVKKHDERLSMTYSLSVSS